MNIPNKFLNWPMRKQGATEELLNDTFKEQKL